MPAAIPYKKAIANRIRRMIRDGVAMKDIMVAIQELQDAPTSFATFYKIYGHQWDRSFVLVIQGCESNHYLYQLFDNR